MYTHEGEQAWKNFAGYDMWEGLVFNTAEKAQQACSDPYFNALYILTDDGSNQCENDFCYAPSKSTEALCHDYTFYQSIQNANGLSHANFNSAYNNSNGICELRSVMLRYRIR